VTSLPSTGLGLCRISLKTALVHRRRFSTHPTHHVLREGVSLAQPVTSLSRLIPPSRLVRAAGPVRFLMTARRTSFPPLVSTEVRYPFDVVAILRDGGSIPPPLHPFFLGGGGVFSGESLGRRFQVTPSLLRNIILCRSPPPLSTGKRFFCERTPAFSSGISHHRKKRVMSHRRTRSPFSW